VRAAAPPRAPPPKPGVGESRHSRRCADRPEQELSLRSNPPVQLIRGVECVTGAWFTAGIPSFRSHSCHAVVGFRARRLSNRLRHESAIYTLLPFDLALGHLAWHGRRLYQSILICAEHQCLSQMPQLLSRPLPSRLGPRCCCCCCCPTQETITHRRL
jgi:hypothetical protein